MVLSESRHAINPIISKIFHELFDIRPYDFTIVPTVHFDCHREVKNLINAQYNLTISDNIVEFKLNKNESSSSKH